MNDINIVLETLHIEANSYMAEINEIEDKISEIIYFRDQKKMKQLFELYRQSDKLKKEWIYKHTQFDLLSRFQITPN